MASKQWASLTRGLTSRRLSSLLIAPEAEIGWLLGDRTLVERLTTAEAPMRVALLQEVLRAQVAQTLRIPEKEIDMEAPLTSLGIDALMGLELRNRIAAALAIDVSKHTLSTCPTLSALAGYLAKRSLVLSGIYGWGIIQPVDWPRLPTCCEFQGKDGKTLYGHLSCPPGPGPHPAVIVSVAHTGGALDEHGRYFQIYEHEPLVKAGFAVFTVDQRGALGHGAAYVNQAEIGRHDVDDLLAAADYLVQRPEIDAKRLALMGTCRGAYTGLLALQRAPERFRTMVLMMGFYDIRPMKAWMHQTYRNSSFDSPFVNMARPYRYLFSAMEETNQDPLRNLALVKQPLWIVHGDADPLSDVAQAHHLAASAQALGIPITLTIVPGMDHDLSERHPAWPALWVQISDFLRQHLAQP
jgi:epothilone polyketide synthase D